MKKDMNNLEIAELLRSVAAAYTIKDKIKNKFRVIAYEKAADAIEHLSSEAKDIFDDGKLDDIPGVGKSIAENLSEIFTHGKSTHFSEVLAGVDPSVFELLKLAGIGPKTADRLTKEFKFDSRKPFDTLLKLARSGEIEKLEGFGEESQKEILQSLKEYKQKSRRHLLNYAIEISNQIADWMRLDKNCVRVEVLGSLRRRASTIGDIDLAVAALDQKKAIDRFVTFPNKSRIIEKGTTSASIMLPSGVQVDIIVQDTKSFGSLLQHFTGSKHHNIKLRELALKQGLSLSEKGIKNTKSKSNKIINFENEDKFYSYLGLKWIPPELREDNGEIEASKKNALPDLVELKDIQADLQIHSDFDVETSHDLGLSSIEEIVNKANSLNYEFIALTEHNPSQKGHDEKDFIEILKKKREAIEQINSTLDQNTRVNHVFNSLEVDIMPNGKLPVPERAFDNIDFALVSIHSSFRLQKNEMTKRVLAALSHPKAKIFAHPTGRKLTQREGVDLDWDQIFDFCVKNNRFIEVNADPMRLDLPDYLVKEAVKYGVKLTLGTDAHHADHMDNMVYGVYTARRGWAEKSNIVNCLTFEEFKKMIR